MTAQNRPRRRATRRTASPAAPKAKLRTWHENLDMGKAQNETHRHAAAARAALDSAWTAAHDAAMHARTAWIENEGTENEPYFEGLYSALQSRVSAIESAQAALESIRP